MSLASATVKEPQDGCFVEDVPDKVDSGVHLKHKRRYCRVDGCQRIVKSQGLCQRHGAKPRNCKVPGCTKQAQGNFDKMCKAHFKALKRETTPIPKVVKSDVPPPAQGKSVYDEILPKSISYTATKGGVMPLIAHLKHGFDTSKPPAWHRNEERAARGIVQIDNPAQQLEGWERELVWMEILVLTGVPGASFRHLARAWGRDKGFHMVLAQFICERHGDVERKKRQAEKKALADAKEDSKMKPLKFKRRKVNRYGLEAKPPDEVGGDVWDTAGYGDADTNEALASEIFDFSEKEFHRVTAKYRVMSNSSVNSDTASTDSNQNVKAQAAMTAILGDKGRNGAEQSLPDAAVALAAMNQIPAVLPPRYNKQQQQPEPSPAVHANTLHSQEIGAVDHALEQDLSQVHLQAQIMVPHKQQDLHHHEAVSLCGQPSKYMHQTQAQPQAQPMNQVPSLFREAQHSLQQQQDKQPVCDVHRGVNVPSYPIDSLSNCNEMSRQVTALHTNHDTRHPNATMHQIAPDSNGHFEHEDHCQDPLTQQVVVVAQQQDIQYQVAPQQPAQQVIQNLPQQGLQMAQLQLQQQSQQNATQVHYIALNQEQANVQLPQSQFINTQQQQPQFELQSHFETLRDQTQHAGNQETRQNQYIPVLQDHKALHIHSTEQQQFGQDLQHGGFGENAPLVSHATQTTQGQYDLLQSQHTDSLQHQHCLQDGFPSKHDQFAASQESPHEQYRTPVHQQQNQGRGLQQAFSGHSDQFQQIQQEATQLPGQHQYTETSQPQQQLQQVSQHSHNGQQTVNSHNQQPNSGSQYHDSSGQHLGQILQVAVHQHTNHQIQVQNNVLQQQEQQVHIQSHAPEVQQLQQSWTTHQLPQTQQVPHPSHQRHHRRLHSQPVFLQQGQIPEPQTNHHRRQQSQPAFFQPGHSLDQNRHRRQFSQPVYLHDMGFGQVHSIGQEEKNVAQPIEQNVLHLFQQAGSSTALPATPFQNTAQDMHVASQQGSHSSFQQQHQEQQQQPQVLPQGSFQQESQTHPQVFHTETAHPDHTHNYLNTQGSSYQQSQQHTIVQSQEAHGHNANADQHVVPHHQDFGNDPLYIHHEMHVAQATGDPFNQGNDK